MFSNESCIKKPKVDWPNHNIVILPVSYIKESVDKEMRSLCKMGPDDTVSNVMWFMFPTEDNEDSKTIRVYVGDKTASKIRKDSLEFEITIQDNIQRRCLVVLMEFYIKTNDDFYAKECSKYAGVLETNQMNDTFKFLDDQYSADLKKKEALHSLINYIQRNRHHS